MEMLVLNRRMSKLSENETKEEETVMKKMASILALVFLISLSTACGAERAKVDINDGGDLTATETLGKEAETTPEAESELTTEEDVSESESNLTDDEPVFLWKDHSMILSGMTVDLAGYGLDDFQGSMVLIRLAAVEGTFTFQDFKQNLFELVDQEGNMHTCKFFVVANKSSSPVLNGMPEDQQEYIDMLFEMGDATMEKLEAAHVNVYEEEGKEPLAVPLKSVSQEVENKGT